MGIRGKEKKKNANPNNSSGIKHSSQHINKTGFSVQIPGTSTARWTQATSQQAHSPTKPTGR